jgi:hypothetical protein
MREWLSRGVLVAGVVALLLYLAPHWPRQQELVFHLGSSRAGIRHLDASWEKESDAQIAGGMTLDFSDPPPEAVRRTLSLPNGKYTVTVELTRQGSGDTRTKTTWSRRVTLGGGETSLPLGDDRP